jgi:hypothetical protein
VSHDRRSIEIPAEVAASAAIPEDLDSSVVGEYHVPDTNRRRRAALAYFVGAALVVGLIAARALPSTMWWTAVVVLITVGLAHLIAGWNLDVREGEALEIASRTVEFAVGHASASLGFVGWRARPVWNVLVFSADEPPSERGLVRIDGIDGTVVDHFSEPVPEPERIGDSEEDRLRPA